MRYSRTIGAALMAATLAVPVFAQHGTPVNRSADSLTVAVFGDWPYSVHLRDTAAPFLLDSINSDPHVRLVVHVGDIHSGSMPCTGAGLNPLPAGSNPGWNQSIWDIFQQFHDPFVYTPGDNEWSDCHKVKQSSSGAPLNELAAVRNLFFPTAGLTLGEHPRQVISQATDFDSEHPEDAQFVENVIWEQSRTVFVTMNVPGGSNDDAATWVAPFTNNQAQMDERNEREAAVFEAAECGRPPARLVCQPRERDAQRGGHRRANRLAIQRIAGRGIQEHGIHAKRCRVPEYASDVGGVGHAVEHDDDPCFLEDHIQ